MIRTDGASLAGVDPAGDIAISNIAGTYYVFGTPLIWAADADIGVSRRQPRVVSVQSNGTTSTTASGSITGALVGGSTMRVGVVSDPADGAKSCWFLRADSADADTAGAGNKRSELLPSSDSEAASLYMDRTYVIGLLQRVADWRSTTDDQATWQLHDNTGAALSPWLTLMYSGETRSIIARYSLNASPSQANTVVVTLWSDVAWAPNTWDQWVIEAVESQTDGAARVWLNGVAVADYSGPLGYQEPAGRGSYWKQGVYHWTDAGNSWDASLSMRETWQKGAYIATGVTPAEMMTALDSIA